MSAEDEPTGGHELAPRPASDIAPTARNAAILVAVRSVLTAALEITTRNAATLEVEAAAPEAPPGTFIERLRWRWRWRIGTLFVLMDVLATVGAWLVEPAGLHAAELIVPTAFVLLACNRTDLHRSRLELSVLDEMPAYLLAAVVGAGAAAATAAVLTAHPPTLYECLLFGTMLFAFLTAARALGYTLARALRRSRLVAHPVLIIGAGPVGQRLAAAMLTHAEYGLKPVGFIDADPSKASSRLPLPVIGGLAALPGALTAFGVHDVVFAFGTNPDAQMVRIVRACVRLDRQVFVVPRFFELYGADRRARVEMIWGVPLVRLRRWPLRPGRRWVKRASDVGLAGLALVALSPVLAACALAVRLEGGKGVIFRQVRVGQDGRRFTLFKFRSMRPTAGEDEVRWNIDGDERIGPVGRFMRRTSLDELPQLVNIVRGDMSLVGPRPERPHFARAFGRVVARYGDRHRVATGLTGWAQVNGLRGDTSIQDRVTFDNYYIDNWSLWNDVKIMIRTLMAVVLRRRDPDPMLVSDPAAELAAVVAGSTNTR